MKRALPPPVAKAKQSEGETRIQSRCGRKFTCDRRQHCSDVRPFLGRDNLRETVERLRRPAMALTWRFIDYTPDQAGDGDAPCTR